VVDDTPANLKLLTEMLNARGYNARPVPNGRRALQAAKHDPPDLILLDINMPDMDGFEVCDVLKKDKDLQGIPVLFISAVEETTEKVRAFDAGGVDFISKPFQFDEVNARVETHLKLRSFQLHLEELVEEKIKELSASQMSTIFALAKLAESRDDETGKHIERVRLYAKIMVDELKNHHRFKRFIDAQFIENIYHATPLHDIGKVGIRDDILLKPGKLTDEEFETMKSHTILGAETLEFVRAQYPNNNFINMGIAIARSHHESWDGSGYPDGLSGDDIPLSARIMTIADEYDALRSARPYKQTYSHEQCVEIIMAQKGIHFDPDIADTFFRIQDLFREVDATFRDD
ncbi:MAG: HD domain-containing phosphohydrolase, partial [Chloroflexota bacterium]